MKNVEDVIDSLREGAVAAASRAEEAAGDIADRIEDALETAQAEGKRVGKRVRRELARRWKDVDRAGRDNAFIMAAGALALGVLVGYLIARDRD